MRLVIVRCVRHSLSGVPPYSQKQTVECSSLTEAVEGDALAVPAAGTLPPQRGVPVLGRQPLEVAVLLQLQDTGRPREISGQKASKAKD